MNEAEYSQPLCTALQVAIVNFLRSCGVSPVAVVGHSSGEIAAAYASGAITSTEAIVSSYCRGLATRLQTRKGSMAAVGMGVEAITPYLVDGVLVACENSPKNVTISGNADVVDKVLEAIKDAQPSVFTRRLQVNIAYHSRKSPCIQPMRGSPKVN